MQKMIFLEKILPFYYKLLPIDQVSASLIKT